MRSYINMSEMLELVKKKTERNFSAASNITIIKDNLQLPLFSSFSKEPWDYFNNSIVC